VITWRLEPESFPSLGKDQTRYAEQSPFPWSRSKLRPSPNSSSLALSPAFTLSVTPGAPPLDSPRSASFVSTSANQREIPIAVKGRKGLYLCQ
jgi:hypothetical protein